MRYLALLGVIGAVCVLGTQQGQAQPAPFSGDYVSIAEAPTAPVTPPDQSSAIAKLAHLAAQERCPEAPVDVTAASSEERRLACSAAIDALQMLGRCGISL